MISPWRLTPRQREALEAVAEAGTQKRAAKALGISHRTVEHLLLDARAAMGVDSTLLAVLLWDRHARKKQEVTP